MADKFPFELSDANLPLSRVRKVMVAGKRLPVAFGKGFPEAGERIRMRAEQLRSGLADDLVKPAIVHLGKGNRLESYADGSMVSFDCANRPTGVLRRDSSKLQVSYDDKGQISHYWESYADQDGWVLWQRDDDGTFRATVDSGQRDSQGKLIVEKLKRQSLVSLDARGCFVFQSESAQESFMITRTGRVIEAVNQLSWPAPD